MYGGDKVVSTELESCLSGSGELSERLLCWNVLNRALSSLKIVKYLSLFLLFLPGELTYVEMRPD